MRCRSGKKRIERIVVPLMTSMKGHGRNHDGDDFGSAGARASHPPAPARCSAYDRGQRSARSTCGRSPGRAMPTPPRRTGRPRPRRSRYSSATSASGCAEGALQRNGYAVTQRCVATVAPQQPRNGVTPSRPSTATPAIACSMSSWSRTPWLNRKRPRSTRITNSSPSRMTLLSSHALV